MTDRRSIQIEVPDEPDWSSMYGDELDISVAHTLWCETIQDMSDAGTLRKIHGHAIQRMAQFKVQFDRAALHVAEHGPLLPVKGRGKSGGLAGQWNPYWAVMRHADDCIKAIEDSLCLTVKSTKAGKEPKAKREPIKAEKYLKMAA